MHECQNTIAFAGDKPGLFRLLRWSARRPRSCFGRPMSRLDTGEAGNGREEDQQAGARQR